MIMTQKNFAVSVFIMLLALCIGTPVRAEKGWIDVTAKYLKNPGFDGNSNAYWTYTSDAHSQTVRCEAMEFWNGTWDLYQVISNLPAGEYRMTVQAYYRCMDNDPGYQNYLNGTEDITGVMYAGQIVELGTVEDIFYDPKHPYTWALLSSLPQLTERGTDLFSIPGTPPSLYNKIVGDAFAPRNQYAMAIDLKEEPPMFQVSDTHYAKTWLLDPRAPKTEAPKNIQNLHEKMVEIYGDSEGEGE